MRTYFYDWIVILALNVLAIVYHAEAISIYHMLQEAENASSTGPTNVLHSDTGDFFKVEMDILLSPEDYRKVKQVDPDSEIANITQSRKKRAISIKPNRHDRRWPHGLVNYQIFSSHFNNKQKWAIIEAMRMWEKHTCVRFKQNIHARYRIMFRKGIGGCYSSISMIGKPQEIGLGFLCARTPIVVHEIGHALGLWHEHNRPDRDNYVTVYLDRVTRGEVAQLIKMTWKYVERTTIPYDYKSIMHYSKNSFAKDASQLVIVTKDPRYQDIIGEVGHLSYLDVKSMNIMYNCKRHKPGCTKTDKECPGNGFVSKDCICLCEGPGEDKPTRPCSGTTVTKPIAPITTGGCTDRHASCSVWSRTGECSKNSAWMLPNCAKSCGRCNGGVSTCVDKNASCPTWARMGECNKNRAWMLPNCPKSCNSCSTGSNGNSNCRDNHTACQKWRKAGFCTGRFKNSIQPKCRRSCGLCR